MIGATSPVKFDQCLCGAWFRRKNKTQRSCGKHSGSEWTMLRYHNEPELRARMIATAANRVRNTYYPHASELLARGWSRQCWFGDGEVDESDTIHPRSKKPSVHHIDAVADGGSDEDENLAIAHYSCNSAGRAVF